MAEPRILVMMATYNGRSQVADQIDSILSQRDVSVDILISDDGSTDGTIELCEAYASSLENVTFRQNPHNVGVAWNFMNMVYGADPSAHDYYAFSDQDDIWLPSKLTRAVSMLRNDGRLGLLYYSNMLHVDSAHGTSHASDIDLYRDHAQNVGTALVSNWAAGCTMVFDAELLRLLQATKPQSFPRIHDAWVHLVALTCAATAPDFDSHLIEHRISGANITLGRVSRDFGHASPKRLKSALSHVFERDERPFSGCARELVDSCSVYMYPEAKTLAMTLASFPHSLAVRLRALASHLYTVPTTQEQILLSLRVLFDYL